ncbi:MAG TPA: hypothetical protein DC049_08855, partial [Spirochaetia bacterium]|nr:hypothetical protein [Spirochaetia bacterium]
YIKKDEDIFYAGHAGINDYTDEKWAKNVLISEDTRFAQSGYKFAGAPFAWYRFSAGIKTFAHFSQNADGFGITAFCAESLPGPHEIPGYAHGAFFLPNAASAFRTILDNGATQHFMISDGNLLAALSFFARICGFSFTAIPGVEKQTQQELS